MHRLFLVLSLAFGLVSHVAAGPAQFSANIVQSGPEGETMSSKLYVGDGVERTESSHDGQRRISIVDKKRRIAWLLNPDKKEYVEMRGPAPGEGAGPRPPSLPGDPASPCQRDETGLTCNQLGIENLAGRTTEKWELITSRQGQSVRAVFWFDRKLRTPIRQEFPGGYARELRNINEGLQPAHLFAVPQGYTKIDLPTRQGIDSGGPGTSPDFSRGRPDNGR